MHNVDFFDYSHIQSLTDLMRLPETLNIYLVSKLVESETDKSEEWYSTKFSKSPFTESMLNRINYPSSFDSLGVPPQNPFLPESTSLLSEVPNTEPQLISSTPNSQIWHKQDSLFKTPKAEVRLRIFKRDKDTSSDIKEGIFIEMWDLVMKEIL
jgi:secreted Zn-dependent insulinase-like peptidase